MVNNLRIHRLPEKKRQSASSQRANYSLKNEIVKPNLQFHGLIHAPPEFVESEINNLFRVEKEIVKFYIENHIVIIFLLRHILLTLTNDFLIFFDNHGNESENFMAASCLPVRENLGTFLSMDEKLVCKANPRMSIR